MAADRTPRPRSPTGTSQANLWRSTFLAILRRSIGRFTAHVSNFILGPQCVGFMARNGQPGALLLVNSRYLAIEAARQPVARV